MTISALLQAGFRASQVFLDQVDSIVVQQANEKLKALPPGEGNPDALANIIRSPSAFGFARAMLADAGWDVTYDAWAADPASADYAILVNVQALFNKMTGYQEYVAPPP